MVKVCVLNECSTPIPLNRLAIRTGVKYWAVELSNGDYKKNSAYLSFLEQFSNVDQVELASSGSTYNQVSTEARLILSGSGYYDIETSVSSESIRICVEPGDLFTIPAGCVRRFVVTSQEPCMSSLFYDEIEQMQCDQLANAKYLETLSTSQSCSGKPVILGDRAKALANYPHSRVLNGLVYFSGTSSRRPDNTHIGATAMIAESGEVSWILDIEAQTRAVLENIKWILQCSGSDLQHLVSITVFLVDMKAHYSGFNRVFNEYFDAESAPARTTVAVKALPHPNLVIEIQGIAGVCE